MVAWPVRHIGAAARRGIGSARRALATAGDDAARRLEKKAGHGFTANQLWLLSRINQIDLSSSMKLHELRREAFELERQLNNLDAKIQIRDCKAKRTAEMTDWAVRGIGTFVIFAMHFHLLYT